MSVQLSNGDGTFQSQRLFSSRTLNSIASGDFNGDGVPDLAVTSQSLGTVELFLSAP